MGGLGGGGGWGCFKEMDLEYKQANRLKPDTPNYEFSLAEYLYALIGSYIYILTTLFANLGDA
jgi:hypothetical protein